MIMFVFLFLFIVLTRIINKISQLYEKFNIGIKKSLKQSRQMGQLHNMEKSFRLIFNIMDNVLK